VHGRSPSAPVFTNLKIQATRPPSVREKTRKYPTGPRTPNPAAVLKSHSRPHTSNDNPFSESQFKTLKYQPTFPRRFGCIEDAKGFCRAFFACYNQAHHHVGLGLMTSDQVHYRQADAIHAARQATLDCAFARHPERFVKQPPTPPHKPTATWINPPQHQANSTSLN